MGKPVVLHTEESDGWAGQEIRILDEMLGMKDRGYRMLLATPRHARIYDKASAAGIETFNVDMTTKDFVKGAIEIGRIIRDRHVSIINTHSSKDSWIGSIAGRCRGIRVLRTRHISSALNKSPLTRLVYGPLCDRVITTGSFIKNQLVSELGLDPGKIYPIPTGIDIKRFEDASGDALRAELGIRPDAIVLGTAAALRSWKAHEYILRAMPLIHKEFPGARLVLAGDGPQRASIENCIRALGIGDIVHMLGHRDDVPQVIKAFDISLLVSYASEGIPQFVLQSMACGKPVIGSSVGGIPEVVLDGANGLIVPPRDPEAIAGAVRRILSDNGLREKMGRRGHEMAALNHTRERMLDELEALYGKLGA